MKKIAKNGLFLQAEDYFIILISNLQQSAGLLKQGKLTTGKTDCYRAYYPSQKALIGLSTAQFRKTLQ
ncbi:hypothetical protein [Streptococcus zhangguiae]|uniref:hypothetical protein n=1 Tax=Streptococcus zhangguiae TaxID=2664091 RepID=UPI0013658F17|nr:hypothetical protein [Streptococcus sp. zg-70]